MFIYMCVYMFIVYLLSVFTNYNFPLLVEMGRMEGDEGEGAEERLDEKSRTNNEGRKRRREPEIFLEI